MNQQKKQTFLRNIIFLALFLVPIFYISQILATGIHEIIGHGLSAVALGGKFNGFTIRWDGMGWAFTRLPLDATKDHEIIRLAAGVISTTIMGVLFLILAYIVRTKLSIRLPLLLMSFSCLMEGIPYVFWNSYHPVPPGDIGKIITLWHIAELPGGAGIRNFLLVISGMTFFTVTFLMCALLFQGIEEAILAGKRFSSQERFWMLLLFLAAPGTIVWFTFDWNQLAPGIGFLPCFVGAASILISAIILYRFPLKPRSDIDVINISWFHLFVSFSSLIVIVTLILFWLQNGVIWD